MYQHLVDLVIRYDLASRGGPSRDGDPVLLLLPNKFKPGYVPSVPGFKVVLGEMSEASHYKTVVRIDTFKLTQYGFAVDVVHNPHISLGQSVSYYTVERTPDGWRCGPPKREEDRPLAGKS